MGSLKAGQVVPEDRPDLIITPNDDLDPRGSTIDVLGPVGPTPDGIMIAVLIREKQTIAKFEIREASGPPKKIKLYNDPKNETALKAWHHTSPNQQWVVYYAEANEVPHAPFDTKFSLKPKPNDPQDVLWVVVKKNDGFGTNHRLYGWTEYPKATPARAAQGGKGAGNRRGGGTARPPAKSPPARASKRRR
jgi:hypothetical protein